MVPRDFLPVAGITTGCRNDVVVPIDGNDVVVPTDGRVPVCMSGRKRVTAGDALRASCRVIPRELCLGAPGICCGASGEEFTSGAGVNGPGIFFTDESGVVCGNVGLLSGKGSCSVGESWLTSPGSCNP